MVFVIIACSRCGRLLMAKDDQKTRTCPYCGSKVIVSKTKRMASAQSASEASMILRRLKGD